MTRFPDDVDPKRLNVGPRKRKRRKLRDLPDPPATLKAAQPTTEKRLYRLPLNPGIILEPTERDTWRGTSPHNDRDLWEVQIHDAFGTRSSALVTVFIRQLKRLCRQDWDDDSQQWKWNETELNAVLAMVADVKPRNATEATLAAQMVAVHMLTMNLAQEAFNSGGMVMERSAALLSKLARTYTMQLETLRLMRGGKKPTIRQAITVKRETHYHQHQHLHDHREAGGVQETEGQAHDTRATTIEGRAALPSPESRGEVVPLSRRKG